MYIFLYSKNKNLCRGAGFLTLCIFDSICFETASLALLFCPSDVRLPICYRVATAMFAIHCNALDASVIHSWVKDMWFTEV